MDDKLIDQMEKLVIDEVADRNVEEEEEEKEERMAYTHAELKALSDFEKIKNVRYGGKKVGGVRRVATEYRRIPVPRHRRTVMKEHWESIVNTLIKHMKLQVRMNTRKGCVEMRTCKETEDIGAI